MNHDNKTINNIISIIDEELSVNLKKNTKKKNKNLCVWKSFVVQHFKKTFKNDA